MIKREGKGKGWKRELLKGHMFAPHLFIFIPFLLGKGKGKRVKKGHYQRVVCLLPISLFSPFFMYWGEEARRGVKGAEGKGSG